MSTDNNDAGHDNWRHNDGAYRHNGGEYQQRRLLLRSAANAGASADANRRAAAATDAVAVAAAMMRGFRGRWILREYRFICMWNSKNSIVC